MEHTHILTHNHALDYITAGKAIFTVCNTQTGNRFTYKVKQMKQNGKVVEGLLLVYVLNGSDNVSNYTYIGRIYNGRFGTSANARVTPDAQSFRGFEYILNNLKTNTLPSQFTLYRPNQCGKCGKRLTVPSSILSGLGPLCVQSIKHTANMYH